MRMEDSWVAIGTCQNPNDRYGRTKLKSASVTLASALKVPMVVVKVAVDMVMTVLDFKRRIYSNNEGSRLVEMDVLLCLRGRFSVRPFTDSE